MSGTSPLDSAGKPTSFTIFLNGSLLPMDLIVYKISTYEEVNKIARAKIEIIGGDTALHLFPESEETTFEPGIEVKISLGFDQLNEVVFSGIIVKHSISIKPGYQIASYKNLVVLECADKAIAMTYQKTSEIFNNKTDSDIITSLITAKGVTKKITSTTYSHPFLIQNEMTNWDFLLLRAKANGFIVFNSQGKLTVGKPEPAAGSMSKSTLIYGDNITDFEGEIDATTQLQEVSAGTFNPYTHAAVSQTGSEPTGFPAQGNLTGKVLGTVASPPILKMIYNSPMLSSELKVYADALLVLSRIQRIRGTITFRGLNKFLLGGIVSLKGFGSHFDGDTLITGIEHTMADGIYLTKIKFGLQPNVLNGDKTPNQLPIYNPVKGLHIGKVTKIASDPDGEYKIQVLIPTLKQTGLGIWARLSHLYATAKAGSFFIPEIGSSVVVGFLDEDPRFPVVLGCLYNSSNAPPETMSTTNPKKAIYSKSLMKLEFDDQNKILTLLTPGGNSIIISDKARGITITDVNGSTIKMSASGIFMSSNGDITLKSGKKLNLVGTTGIAASCALGTVDIKGLNVAAEATLNATLKGTMQAQLESSLQTVVKGGIVMIN
jgi:Rhs element Vgr protein